ncbi:MAG: DUF4389 domain-containing protein [Gemmatimonadota bacterium]
MDTRDDDPGQSATYPIAVNVQAALEERNRLTTAFRFFLAIPHLLIVGAPVAMVTSLGWSTESGWDFEYGSGGVLGAVAGLGAVIAWFAILFTGRHPEGLWKLGSFYLRWRTRATAYVTLLRDEYPPFGEGPYPAELVLPMPEGERDRLTVALRFFLAIPHLFVVWLLSLGWAFTTALAWLAILITGRYPKSLYGFAIGVLAWTMRVEAYMLLLRDEYPPFTLRA